MSYHGGMKRLVRNTKNRMFAGVLSGFGDYFEVDTTALRVLFVFFVLITGFFPGVLAYLIAIFLIPPDISNMHTAHEKREETDNSETQNGGQHRP